MSDELAVYLHGARAGVLSRESQARLNFEYDREWIRSGGAPLSLSLPVRDGPFTHDECIPFFSGLLPEGEFLRAVSRALHVSAGNPFQLLAEIGGECAGAVSLGAVGGPIPGRSQREVRWLDEDRLRRLLDDLPHRPLLAAIDEEDGVRISLAGAQDKVGVLAQDGKIGLSRGNPPSTHILKAPIPGVPDVVANEAFCLALGSAVGLEVAGAEPRSVGSAEFLLVRRYDRDESRPDGRLHQEDLCQALGVDPARKYEGEGGPGVAACADLIRRHSAAPARDLIAFADALLFNFLIGNNDAHAKNYALLLDGPGSVRMAPLYDLICTAAIEGTNRKTAMKYGGESRPAYLRRRHMHRLAGDLQARPALVERRAQALLDRIPEGLDAARRALPERFRDRPIIDRVSKVVAERGDRLKKALSEAQES